MKYLKISIVFLAYSIAICSYGQNNTGSINDILGKAFNSSKKKLNGGRFIGQIIKGKCSGMGASLFKDNSIYIGDYYRDCIQGYGIYIAAENKSVPNCTGSKYFIGHFLENKKEGVGKCFNEKGELIYEGKFSKDKPTDYYDTTVIKLNDCIKIIDLGNQNYYLGEYKNEEANGLGIVSFDNNSSLLQSSFKEGKRCGISLYIMADGEWQTMNIDGEFIDIISSSEHYREIETTSKANYSESLSTALNLLSQAVEQTAQAVSQLKRLNQDETLQSENNDENGYTQGEKTMDGSSLPLQYQNWEKRAKAHYNSLTNSGIQVKVNGKDVGGTNGESLNGGNYTIQKQKLREAQKEMKRIREKARKRGINIQKSEYEDVIVKY